VNDKGQSREELESRLRHALSVNYTIIKNIVKINDNKFGYIILYYYLCCINLKHIL
jgi:hypothetical protein